MIPILFFNTLQSNSKIVTLQIFLYNIWHKWPQSLIIWSKWTSAWWTNQTVTCSYFILLVGFVSKHAGDFFLQIRPRPRAHIIAQRLIPTRHEWIQSHKEMADEIEIFSSVILESLTTAEDQLANKEIDCERVRCAINDLKPQEKKAHFGTLKLELIVS